MLYRYPTVAFKYNYFTSKKYRRGDADAISIVNATKVLNLTGPTTSFRCLLTDLG